MFPKEKEIVSPPRKRSRNYEEPEAYKTHINSDRKMEKEFDGPSSENTRSARHDSQAETGGESFGNN